MALINPKIPYKTIRDSLRDLYRNNMAALNVNLTAGTFTSNDQIVGADPEIENTMLALYPMIFIRIENKNEAFRSIGNAGRKHPVVNFKVFGIVSDMSVNKEDEIIYLASNMEGLLRDNIQFDNNVIKSDLGDTTWGLALEKGVYIKAVGIDIACTVEIR